MNIKKTISMLGPGLLWAGAAIGVSHLVQSTRAGALFGFELVWLVVAANIFKYPFFEFGPRYAAATGETLIQGYKRIGKWAVVLYFALTVGTMFIIMAAITAVTAGLFENVFQTGLSSFTWMMLVLMVAAAIVSYGKYSLLDKVVKYIIILLSISVLVAFFFAFSGGYNPATEFQRTVDWAIAADVALLIAVAGWMPAPLDISVWHSVWTIAKQEETGKKATVKESLFDFNVGFIGTGILALAFLGLGALVMYGSGESLSPKASDFAGQIIDLFTTSIGGWSYFIIAGAAIATMVSTTLTCMDAYPRILRPITKILIPKSKDKKVIHYFWLGVVVLGTFLILKFFMKDFKMMIDLATTLSFLSAPILGWLNYKAITGDNVPKEHQPKLWLRLMSYVGLFVLTTFGLYYLYIKFI